MNSHSIIYININAVAVSLNKMNIMYFINLFTIINMLLNLTFYAKFFDFNNLIIKFMITDSQNTFNTFNFIILL